VRLELVRNEWSSSTRLIPLLLYQSNGDMKLIGMTTKRCLWQEAFVQRDAPAMPLLLFQSNFVNALEQRQLNRFMKP
jgi:hypothetical protein